MKHQPSIVAPGHIQRIDRRGRFGPLGIGILVPLFMGCQMSLNIAPVEQATFDLVISNGRVMDPESGLDATRTIGILDGIIAAVGRTPLKGRKVIDAAGLVVAPGFIDLNTYDHGDPFFRLRAADGVTSVLNLEDGAVDVGAYYDALDGRALIHHGIAVGHDPLRDFAVDPSALEVHDGVTNSSGTSELAQRALSGPETEALAVLIERGLEQGAVAVGFGIEYTPGATHGEILRMIDIAAAHGASAHLHIRDWDSTREWGELYEVFAAAIHSGGDLHVNHLPANFGSFSSQALAFIDQARAHGLRITTECYPYTAGLTFIESALFDDWESWPDESFQLYEWPQNGERLTREAFQGYRQEGGVVIIHAQDEAVQEAAIRACLAHPPTHDRERRSLGWWPDAPALCRNQQPCAGPLCASGKGAFTDGGTAQDDPCPSPAP